MATSKVELYTGTRVTHHSTQSFDTIMTKLYSSIGSVKDISAWQEIATSIKDYSVESKEKFITTIEKRVGPHGFMIFQEYNHGAWTPLFGVGDGLQCKRIILGNPLIAITMLEHDMTAGLAVPVELLVLERKEGGVDLVFQWPSALITGLNKDEKLVDAASKLDEKLDALVKDIAV